MANNLNINFKKLFTKPSYIECNDTFTFNKIVLKDLGVDEEKITKLLTELGECTEIDFHYLSTLDLPKKFINAYKDFLDWDEIVKTVKLSTSFITKHEKYIYGNVNIIENPWAWRYGLPFAGDKNIFEKVSKEYPFNLRHDLFVKYEKYIDKDLLFRYNNSMAYKSFTDLLYDKDYLPDDDAISELLADSDSNKTFNEIRFSEYVLERINWSAYFKRMQKNYHGTLNTITPRILRYLKYIDLKDVCAIDDIDDRIELLLECIGKNIDLSNDPLYDISIISEWKYDTKYSKNSIKYLAKYFDLRTFIENNGLKLGMKAIFYKIFPKKVV